ncbi:hypothetical protein M3I53_35515 [Paraburkholderia sp. CNPSo 3272]|uniref:hypothetical protein n=1 Tax=Paraburkholderia sp. CNPSo 3272 TaxID=2940931 RepID=UPI0020B6BF77|nr:hypothetical protein [Paraburkholderia sp. CNPSo 3272]MCP3728360.1 hypothetical protein [Paraburkholderia sp. CNPSo 3272]
MQNLFGFRLAKRAAIGLLQLGVPADWGCGGLGWLLEHYVRWFDRRVTPQLPAVAVAVAEGVAHRLRRDRDAT